MQYKPYYVPDLMFKRKEDDNQEEDLNDSFDAYVDYYFNDHADQLEEDK